jgi:hypothetical protein
MSKHTPTPWTYTTTYPAGDYVIHAQGIPWKLAYLSNPDPKIQGKYEWPLEANAAFIVRAVNAHADMLALLKELIDIEGPCPGNAEWAHKVRAAIAKAEGQ